MTNPQASSDRLVVDLGAEVGITYWEQSLLDKLRRRHAEGITVPGISDIRADLRQLHTPVPARVSPGRQGRGDLLRLYIDGRYTLLLHVSKYGQGYVITDVFPLGLRDADEIVRGGFALAAGAWRLYDHPRELPQRLDARWGAVKRAWLERPKPGGAATSPQTLPREHRAYLDDVKSIVEKAREIELNGRSSDRICRYQRITPAAAKRRTAQSVYKFQLMGDSRLAAGVKVHIDEHPSLRGEIASIQESLITVRFEQPVDFQLIPQLGAFVETPNTTSLNMQAEAVEILREQRARNPRLLEVLVDHSFQLILFV